MGNRIESYNTQILTRRRTSQGAEDCLGVPSQIHEHGFIYLTDYMGDDGSVAEAARTSYGKGTAQVSDDIKLIRHLMRHWHTSPFEMVVLKYHMKMPLFIAQQVLRHRTASLNQYSLRYSLPIREFYLPPVSAMLPQSKSNNQGRAGDQIDNSEHLRELLRAHNEESLELYDLLTQKDTDLARELARTVIPTSFYTEMYWCCDLHNIFHFLRLRCDKHAQQEIRDLADAMARIVEKCVPECYQAFMDYRVNSIQFSALELKTLSGVLQSDLFSFAEGMTKREEDELMAKLDQVRSLI